LLTREIAVSDDNFARRILLTQRPVNYLYFC
jgi:hypothetical protein